MSLTWWEKTVEYKFVMLVAQANKLFLAPLDGGHERAGDSVFSTNNLWVLIEFKKDAASIGAEREKFLDYEEARSSLVNRDGHHHIILGRLSTNDRLKLDLRFQTYFSENESDLKSVLESGVPFSDFYNYVNDFIKFKKPDKRGSRSGGSMDEFALVAGVNADNEIVACLSLSEFLREFGLELGQEPEQERYLNDGPSW